MGRRSPLTPVIRKRAANTPTRPRKLPTPARRQDFGASERIPHQIRSRGTMVTTAARRVRLRCWWERDGSRPTTPTVAEPMTRMTMAIHHRIGRGPSAGRGEVGSEPSAICEEQLAGMGSRFQGRRQSAGRPHRRGEGAGRATRTSPPRLEIWLWNGEAMSASPWEVLWESATRTSPPRSMCGLWRDAHGRVSDFRGYFLVSIRARRERDP